MTRRNDRHIRSFGQNIRFSNGEPSPIGRGEVCHRRASETQVHRSFVRSNGFGSCLGLVVITRIDHDHVRQHFHQANIFQDLVRRTVFPKGKSCVRSTDLYILAGICNALTDLVVHTACREVCEGSGKWNLPADGHTRSDSHHIGFGNTYLEESFRVLICEGIHFQGTGEVGTQCHHIFVLIAQFLQSSAESRTRVLVACVGVLFHS